MENPEGALPKRCPLGVSCRSWRPLRTVSIGGSEAPSRALQVRAVRPKPFHPVTRRGAHALGSAPVSSRPAPSGRSPGRRFASRRCLGITARRLPRAGAEASSLRSPVRRRPSRSPVARRPSRPTTVPSLQGRSPSGNSQDSLAVIPRIPPESAEADPFGVPLPARRPVEGAVS
jgi:hypothetical protein